jgi:hypothetical protein
MYRAVNNYLDQRSLRNFGRMFTDVLECIEVFLVAYTCFNLNLEIFGETLSNRQQRCMSILHYRKHHYESRINDESLMF